MIARKPTPTESQAAAAAGTPSPEVAASRLRMMFCRDLEASLVAARRVRELVARHGRAPIESALGAEGSDLGETYSALRTYILALDPTADVPDLTA